MNFEIHQQPDGSFICSTQKGRKVSGIYDPDHSERAERLVLFATVVDQIGQPKAIVKRYDVTGFVSQDELRELVEALGSRCEDVERGEA